MADEANNKKPDPSEADSPVTLNEPEAVDLKPRRPVRKKRGASPVRWIGLTIIPLALIACAFYVVKRVFDIPTKTLPMAIEKGGQALVDTTAYGIEKLSSAVQSKTIISRYQSTASELAGSTRLQVASLDQVEIFTRAEENRLGRAEVSATAPVQFTYYLDLAGDWEFSLDGNHLTVSAPHLQPNKPAVDVSDMKFRVDESSVFKDEAAIAEALKATMTAELGNRATNNIKLVKEIARRQVETFVRQWLQGEFGNMDTVRVTVLLGEEAGPHTVHPNAPATPSPTQTLPTPTL